MRHLDQFDVLANLHNGRSVEQLLSAGQDADRRIIRFLVIHREREGQWTVTLHEVADVGTAQYLDIYSFPQRRARSGRRTERIIRQHRGRTGVRSAGIGCGYVALRQFGYDRIRVQGYLSSAVVKTAGQWRGRVRLCAPPSARSMEDSIRAHRRAYQGGGK